MKIVSQLDAHGYLAGSAIADEDPLEPGNFLLPGGCVDVPPVSVPVGMRAKFKDGAFVLEQIPAPPAAAPAPAAAPPAPPTAEELIAANMAAIQRELDLRAQTRGYDNILSACSYAAQPEGAPFQAEGAAFLAWRSAVWQKAYATLAEVKAGAPMPTPEQAVADMPILELPA